MTHANDQSSSSNSHSPFTVPLLYGTASVPLDTKDLNSDFRWCVFLRHPDGDSLKPYIKSVTFLLHDSFETPLRKLTEEPFAVIETGWGEFNIQIIIELQDLL